MCASDFWEMVNILFISKLLSQKKISSNQKSNQKLKYVGKRCAPGKIKA